MIRPNGAESAIAQKNEGEFQEIARPGCRIEFVRKDNEITGVKVSGDAGGVGVFQLLASPSGQLRHIVHFQGFMPNGPPPDPLIPVYMISDIEGLFGRSCPECKSYFRTDCVTDDTACPYCGYSDYCLAFTTPNQQEFVRQYCKVFGDALEKGNDLILDLNKLVDALPENKPQWVYSEERQQNRYCCKHCDVTVDILGDYGGCPKCARRNYSDLIGAKLDDLEKQFNTATENLTDRHEREVEWEKLLRCVSEFEAMANDLRDQLLRLPATPRRKSDLRHLSFQRIIQTNDSLNNWFGFEMLKDISPDDRHFMNKMFNRRHVFTHKAGKVDQEYLDNTGDTNVRLNQTIRLKSKEIRRLIPLVRQAAKNLIEGYESIS